jgi:hypothetical protein
MFLSVPTHFYRGLRFLEMAKTAKDGEALIAVVNAKYPQYKTQAGLRFSSFAFIDKRDGKTPPPAAK